MHAAVICNGFVLLRNGARNRLIQVFALGFSPGRLIQFKPQIKLNYMSPVDSQFHGIKADCILKLYRYSRVQYTYVNFAVCQLVYIDEQPAFIFLLVAFIFL